MKAVRFMNMMWPFSALLVEGRKTVETRRYPIPEAVGDRWVGIISTPMKADGPMVVTGVVPTRYANPVKAEVIGFVRFGECFEFTQDTWEDMRPMHLVADDMSFGVLFGWPVREIVAIEPVPWRKEWKRGMVWALPPSDFPYPS